MTPAAASARKWRTLNTRRSYSSKPLPPKRGGAVVGNDSHAILPPHPLRSRAVPIGEAGVGAGRARGMRFMRRLFTRGGRFSTGTTTWWVGQAKAQLRMSSPPRKRRDIEATCSLLSLRKQMKDRNKREKRRRPPPPPPPPQYQRHHRHHHRPLSPYLPPPLSPHGTCSTTPRCRPQRSASWRTSRRHFRTTWHTRSSTAASMMMMMVVMMMAMRRRETARRKGRGAVQQAYPPPSCEWSLATTPLTKLR
mmetsp:Transcript_37079/g.60179  ORF Transcript_37079/g.60179 Transcript_37079/m.60179 type:complete len:250 (-) Transcript_37079:350-1099(-)